MLNKAQRRQILSSANDLRVMRESIANDIHRATPDALKRALESVDLLGQIVHELRTTALPSEPSPNLPDVRTRPIDFPPLPVLPPAVPVVLPLIADLKAAIVRGQTNAYAPFTRDAVEDYETGWRRGYDGGWLNGLKRAAEILHLDVSDVVRPHPSSPEAKATTEATR